MAVMKTLIRTKNLYRQQLMQKPNVLGVGIGFKRVQGERLRDQSYAIVCLVRQKTSDLPPGGHIPKSLDAMPTDVVEVGHVVALQDRRARHRPALGGVSIGHYAITAGTLGCVVRDRGSGERLILSNNHVLANSNTARIGDAILQPAATDGGTLANDIFARLLRYVPLDYLSQPGTCFLANWYARFGNWLSGLFSSKHQLYVLRQDADAFNRVDAAVARPLIDTDLLDEVLDIGAPQGLAAAELGMPLRKSGRTTGTTSGELLALDTTIDVSYGQDRTARFDGQLLAGAMSQGGDSGSLIFSSMSQQAVGLLFAGSSSTTIFTPMADVLDALKVDL